MTFFKKHWKGMAGLLVVVVLILATRDLPVMEALQRMAESLQRMGWTGVALFALVYFIAGLLCIPVMPLALTAGYVFGTLQGVMAVHTGAVAAAAAGFLLGRVMGRRRAAAWLRRSERFHALDDAIAQEGWKIVGLLRMQAIPFGVSNYLYGMTKIDFWHYLLATGIAMLPGHLIFVHLASVGGKHLSGRGSIGTLEVVSLALAILSKIALVLLATHLFRKHKRGNRGPLRPEDGETSL